MQTMTISLPDQLKGFGDDRTLQQRKRVCSGSHPLDEKRNAEEKLKAMLTGGIQGSEPSEMTRQGRGGSW